MPRKPSPARVIQALLKITDKTDIEFDGEFIKKSPVKAVKMDEEFVVDTLEGDAIKGKAGDYLCQGVKGERWPIDAEIFEETYEAKKKAARTTTKQDLINVAQGLPPEDLGFEDNSRIHAAPRETGGKIYTSSGVIYVITPEIVALLQERDRWKNLVSVGDLEGAHQLVESLDGLVLTEPSSGMYHIETITKEASKILRAFDGYPYRLGQRVLIQSSSGAYDLPGVVRGDPEARETLDDRVWVEHAGGRVESYDPDSLKAPEEKTAALVGTDTASIWALAPEQLHKICQKFPWKDWGEWAKNWGEIELAVREHGGAVFSTGSDGAYEVKVIPTGDHGQDNEPPEIKGKGFLPPYGVPKQAGRGITLVRLGGLAPTKQRGNPSAPEKKGIYAFVWPNIEPFLLGSTDDEGIIPRRNESAMEALGEIHAQIEEVERKMRAIQGEYGAERKSWDDFEGGFGVEYRRLYKQRKQLWDEYNKVKGRPSRFQQYTKGKSKFRKFQYTGLLWTRLDVGRYAVDSENGWHLVDADNLAKVAKKTMGREMGEAYGEGAPLGYKRLFSRDHWEVFVPARKGHIRAGTIEARQLRPVIARMKAAGWWESQGGAMVGDGPLDMVGDYREKLDLAYRQVWGRPASKDELIALGGSLASGDWPVNQWVDILAQHLDMPPKAIANLPEKKLEELRGGWREVRNSGFASGQKHSLEDRPPEPRQEAMARFLEEAELTVRHTLTDSLRMYGINPEEGGTAEIGCGIGIYPVQDASVSLELGERRPNPLEDLAIRVATRHLASLAHDKSVALMKWLSALTRRLGPNIARNTYVVGGAVRDFVLDRPIKDVDIVIDAVASKRDSEWLARKIQDALPTNSNLTTNQYGVAIITVKGEWILEGIDLDGEVIEIANARKESYGGTGGKGYKPHAVEPATIEEDIKRRELTYNTLLLSMADLASGPDKADIIDLTGCGLRDLSEGKMRCPDNPDKVFSDDPSRMVRVIKFALRYGHKLTPDTRAAILRNAPKLRNVPSSHLAQMLTQIVLQETTWKKALVLMEDLNLLEPMRGLILSDKSFRSTLENHVKSQKMDMLFGLLDVGIPLGASLSFLDSSQQTRLRETALGMDRDQAWAFRDALKNPGIAFGDKSFIPGLARQYGISPRDMRTFAPQVAELGRELLLADPPLVHNPVRLRRLLEQRLESRMRRTANKLVQLWGPTLSEELSAASHRKAAITGDGTGVGLFIPLPEELAAQFPKKEEDTSPAHVTFLYIGEVPKDRQESLLTALEGAFQEVAKPVRAALDGLDNFMNQKNKVVFSRIRFSRDLSVIRDQVREKLEEAGFEVADSFPRYNPHTTIEYMGDHDEQWEGEPPKGSWEFNSIEVWGLPKKYEIPFGQRVLVETPRPEIGQRRVGRLIQKRAAAIRLRQKWD